MYNHWQDMGIQIEDAPARTKARKSYNVLSLITHLTQKLIRWIHNNWHVTRDAGWLVAHLVIKRTDVLWRLRKAEVMEEISTLIGIDNTNTHTQNWFNHQMVAMGNR